MSELFGTLIFAICLVGTPILLVAGDHLLDEWRLKR